MWSHHFMGNRWGNSGNSVRLYFEGLQNHCFPGGSEVKASASDEGDLGSIPGLGRSPGERKGYHSSILAWRIPWTVARQARLSLRIL